MAWSWEEDDMDITEVPEFHRANGEMPCEMCRQPLYRHYQPYRVSCGTMVVDCYQQFWKT
jgi:hypothetical protein